MPMHPTTAAAQFGAAAFGLFWGTWGASLPALRESAQVDEAQLGTALLFVGLGALPAMLLTGRAVDRFGARITGALLVTLAISGVLMTWVAGDFVTLAIGMLLVGATSGASDVAENALAGLAEQRSGRRVITISHAVFSSFVVVGSLGTGALLAVGASLFAVYAVAALAITAAGVAAAVLGEGPHASRPQQPVTRRAELRLALPFVAVGLVGALAFATENAHQSWSAIFLSDELDAPAGLTAIAPATFAAFAAVTRFAAGLLTGIPTGVLLVAGAALALAGTLIVGAAQHIAVALLGLALAAIGTSVLYPTLLSRATRDVPADRRGRATSAIATTAYLGFLLGPVYVGLLASAVGLRGAMIGVAALAAAFALLAPVATRRPA